MPAYEPLADFRPAAEASTFSGAVERVTASVGLALDAREAVPLEPAGAVAPSGQDGLVSALTGLEFSIHVSARYHARRRAWYDRLHRLMMLVIATGASAGVAAIFGGLLRQAEYLSVAVALAGVIELAYSLPERARLEDALYRRFNALAAEIAGAPEIAAEKLRSWEAQRLLVRSDADDRLEVLRRLCHNLEAEARGYSADSRYVLWPWQRLLAQLLSLPPLRPLPAATSEGDEP